MRLNKSTSHAIRILIECARADGPLVKVADLAATLDLTMQNVFKIVHILSRAGLITGARGRNGGVGLAHPAAKIRMSDIVRAMEATDMELDAAPSQAGARRAAITGVNRVLDDALEAFVAVLDQHTLADMAGLPKPKSKPASTSRAAPAHRSSQSSSPRALPRGRPGARSSGN